MSDGGPPILIEIGGRPFSCTGEAAPNMQYGGKSNEKLPNGDNRTCRNIKKPIPWKIGGLQIEVDFANGDPEYLEETKDGDDVEIVLTYADKTAVAGVGNIEGELNLEPAAAATTIDLAGGGKLKKL